MPFYFSIHQTRAAKYDSQTSRISIVWKLVRNADCHVSSLTESEFAFTSVPWWFTCTLKIEKNYFRLSFREKVFTNHTWHISQHFSPNYFYLLPRLLYQQPMNFTYPLGIFEKNTDSCISLKICWIWISWERAGIWSS